MVDPNPARGMPLQLQRYWLAGKGAAKIRWGLPHDFNRCVRQLRKYFPKNPEGLCNILHQKVLGAPPGKGHPGEASALLAAMPTLGDVWAGPIAPIGRPTGEPRRVRVFESGSLKHRTLPIPLSWRKVANEGHMGSVIVGRVLGVVYGPDEKGHDYAWAWGDWLSPDVVPEVKEARYLVDQGVVGPSVDPGGRVSATMNPETGFEHMLDYTIGGVTLVSIPAFTEMRLRTFEEEEEWDDEDMALPSTDDDCGCMDALAASVDSEDTFAVNSTGWRGLPLAMRDSPFDNDDAVKRIQAWAGVTAEGSDVGKLRRAFLWHDQRLPETNTTSYRLPVGDIINGRLTLVYHAIYAAAALISGAHGGLPNVPEEDKQKLRNVISEIYAHMAAEFNDASIRAPWDRSAEPGVQMSMADQFAAEEPYGDVKYADPGYRDSQKRYPIDTPDHIRAAWSYINMPKNAKFYNPKQLAAIKARIKAAAAKAGIEISEDASMGGKKDEYAISDTGYPLTPPKSWFDNPKLDRKTPLTVTEDGRVYGHLAAWNECHRDVTMRECVLAPKSRQSYAPFHLGEVVTAEGDTIKVGKIVMDTRHADINLGYASAALHYDNTGDEVAIVRAGEDEHGIWVAGSVVPEATPQKVAKLRRSPLSGDWRRDKGNLELCAALAVNVPAFPVYSMENEERYALVAAGSVWGTDEEDEDLYTAEPDEDEDEELDLEFATTDDIDSYYSLDEDELRSIIRSEIEEEIEQEDRAWELRELLEEDDEEGQEHLARELADLFAADGEPAPPPTQDDAAPAQGEGTTNPEADQAWAAFMNQAMLETRFSVVEEPEGGGEGGEEEPEPQAPPATQQPVQPAPQAPPAAQQPAPVTQA